MLFRPGKIYGVMDDLRLEHQRVQEKYVAMTKALIESCDIDAFRVDPWTEGWMQMMQMMIKFPVGNFTKIVWLKQQ